MLLDIIGVISYIFCHLKCALALFFPYHGSARVLASRPLKMNQATSQNGHILFEVESVSRSAHRTPNFTNPEFQFPQFKVLQSGFFFVI